jgi:shikimate 5-dehydrogenase
VCSYQLIDLAQLGVGVESLPQLLDAVQRQGCAGVNITHPCKQSVIPLLDELSEDAATIGAVNTVDFSAGKRIGHNTEGCCDFPQPELGATLITGQKILYDGGVYSH